MTGKKSRSTITGNEIDVGQAKCEYTGKTQKYITLDDILNEKENRKNPVVIPCSAAKRILWKYHNHSLANQPEWRETFRVLQKLYHWTGMRNAVYNYVKDCHVCACTKPMNSKPKNIMSSIIPQQLWEVLSIDLMDPNPTMASGITLILVVIDCYSRWVKAYSTSTATTQVITDTLEREYCFWFRYPHVVLSDNGMEYGSYQN